MPVLLCPNFFGDLYHPRRKRLNTNKYLGRIKYLSNYLHLQIQSSNVIARGQMLPGAARRCGGRQNPAKEFKQKLCKEKLKNSERVK